MSVQRQERAVPQKAAPARNRAPTTEVVQVVPDHSAGADEMQSKVAVAAYFRAEKRGFEPGHELEDWLAAEADIANIQVSMISPIEAAAPEGSS